jgi:transposase
MAVDVPRAAKTSFDLTDEERATLTAWSSGATDDKRRAMRARIVLLAASGEAGKAIATQLSISPFMVHTWRSRFAEARLDGLANKVISPRKRKYTPEQRKKVLDLFATPPLGGRRAWTRESLGDAAGVHPASVYLILRENGLHKESKGCPRTYTPDDVRCIIDCMRNTRLPEGETWTPIAVVKVTGANRTMAELILASYELGWQSAIAEFGRTSGREASFHDE